MIILFYNKKNIMPIIHDYIDSTTNTKILIWKLTEPVNILLNRLQLSMSELKIYNSLILKRKKEFLGIRCVLNSIGISNNHLFYNIKGKPFLKNEIQDHISLSHVDDLIAIAISNNRIGIDIEYLDTKKIFNIKNKFLRKDERSFINKLYEIYQLHIIWGIKESLYKLNGGYLKNMISNYKVMPFTVNDRRIKSWILSNTISERFWAYHKKIYNYQLIYIIDHN